MDMLNCFNIGEPVALIGRANLFGKTGVVSARLINKNKKLKYKVRVGRDTLTLPPRSLKRIVKSPSFELDEYEIEIVNYCEELRDRLLDKYRKGKLEHGGKPIKIDCGAEIAKEAYDAIIYHRIHLVNEMAR